MAVELEFTKRSPIIGAIVDTVIMVKRSSTHIIRNTDQLLGTFFQPIMFLVLFATIFSGSISQALPPGVTYLNYLMAGIIVQTLAFGSTTTAVAVCNDLTKGIVDRFRSLPMTQISVVFGHVISDLFRNSISTVVMIVTGLVIGFRPQADFVDWLIIAGILMLFTFMFSWLGAVIGIIAKSVEAVQWLSFLIVFPLTFASTAFVPTVGMNKYLKAFVENQPITQVVEAVRALFLGTDATHYIWTSIAWCVGITVIAIPLSVWLYNRKTRQ